MNYEKWEASVPQSITKDPLWNMKVYRLALFASELGWRDATKLMKDRRTLELSDQLYRSLGSISANIAEGYSRSSQKDQARFYEYSLGSARESRDWYYKARYILGDEVAHHRMDFMAQIIRLLLVIIPGTRGKILREEMAEYEIT